MQTADPLNPSATEQLRLKAQHVRPGDRLLDAPAAAFATHGPFVVVDVHPRDCHGMASLLGAEALCYVRADASVLVERERGDEEPLCRTPRCAELGVRADGQGGYCRECEDERREDAAEARAEALREERLLRGEG